MSGNLGKPRPAPVARHQADTQWEHCAGVRETRKQVLRQPLCKPHPLTLQGNNPGPRCVRGRPLSFGDCCTRGGVSSTEVRLHQRSSAEPTRASLWHMSPKQVEGCAPQKNCL